MMWLERLNQKTRSARLPLLACAIALAGLPLFVAGCSNTNGSAAKKSTKTNTNSPGGTSTEKDGTDPTRSEVTYKISSVTIAGSGSSGTTVTVFFDNSQTTDPISNHCRVRSGSSTTELRTCLCQFSWQEVNATGGDTVTVNRTAQTPVTTVQPTALLCNAPAPYNTGEIPNNTVLKIKVIPSPSNLDEITMKPYSYTKGASSTSYSFQDAEGRGFQNIFRYSCFEQFKRGMSVINKTFAMQNPNSSGEVKRLPLASSFCIAKMNGGTQGVGCENLPGQENSAQSYYYNLYIRSTDAGGINESNERYVCPKVQESLGGDGSVGSMNTFWPLDATFALALSSSGDFPIGVEAPSRLSNTGDSSTAGSSCYASPGEGSGNNAESAARILKTCLGFAAKPNTDGTCPYFKDANGQIRLTHRLRRFVAIYPPVFDTDGKMVNQAPALDTIYVLDRPVSSDTADPLKPYTMRGPKPCPFAFFDQKGVLGSVPQYSATNFPGWNNTNVDGIEFPNTDNGKTTPNSCSAVLPLYNRETNVFSMGTVNAANPYLKKRYIRPIRAFAPHYEEDTDFQACAPMADPMRDPPLHFAKDTTTGNVAWCAESYPSQNNNVDKLDYTNGGNSYSGQVVPFTSHYVKHAVGPDCLHTRPSIPTSATVTYPNTGLAYHQSNYQVGNKNTFVTAAPSPVPVYADQTCDRTVLNSQLTWARFPLLARASRVEDAIASDSTYGCTVSYDAGGGKAGKASPKQGCCGTAVKVWTGATTCTTSAGCDQYKFNTTAHLEPSATTPMPCLIPEY